MKKLKPFIYLILMLGIMQFANAQSKIVKGTILDENGQSMPGASILLKGTARGTTSDADGKFSLEIAGEEPVLAISFIGYKTQDITVGNLTQLEIKLIPELTQLDDVVVTGYNQKVEQRDVTGAIVSIKSEALESIPVISISSLLGSQSTGIQTVSLSGGAPGGRGAIMLRGNTSISGDLDANTAFSNPLYVIDGVQTTLEDLAGYNVSNVDFLASLNPADIKSIDILKDASASAIYGSRGANGVIIITTKGGAALEKPEFTFSANFGFQPIPNLVPMLVGAAERRAKMRMIKKWWPTDEAQDSNVPMVLSDSLNSSFNNNADYQGIFYRPGKQQQYTFSMRGGSEKSNYRLSVGYSGNEGTVKGTGFNRYTLNANINSKVGTRFTNQLRARVLYTDTKTGQGNPYRETRNINSVLPISPTDMQSSLFYLSPQKRQSLEGQLVGKLNTDRAFDFTFTNLATLTIIPDLLTFNSQLSFVYDINKKNFYEPSTVRTNKDGFASYNLYIRKNVSSDAYLSLFKSFRDHEFTGILGNKIDYNQYEEIGITAEGFGSDAIKVINGRYKTSEISGYTDISANSLVSYFGRVSYKYKDRYIIGANYSIDGSSRFGTDNRWAKFPSLSAAWIFSEESFLEPYLSRFLDFGKVRFSWGMNGKQTPNNYLRYGSYNTGYGGNALWSNQMTVSSYAGVTGVVPNYDAIGNPGLSWESSEQWDLGLELDMFKRRVSVTFDAYHKQTDNLFFDVKFPAYSGYNGAKANVAGILNYGWESMVKYHVFPKGKDLQLELSFGLSRNSNYVTSLPNGNKDYLADGYGYVVGRPITLYNMLINDYIIDELKQLPVNTYTGEPLRGSSAWANIRPGFPIWKDVTGDYLLGDGLTSDEQLARDYSPVPDLLGSFNINLKYKAWYLQAYSQFSFGAEIYNTVHQSYFDSYDRGGDNWARRALVDLSKFSFWEKPGDGAAGVRYPALYPSVGGSLAPFYGFRNAQTLWIESGDYWKITNVAVGYTFDSNSFIKKAKLTSFRIYASILNPWQWQRSTAVPDASLVDARGYVFGNGYPQTKTISIGIDTKF
jgi:TonB-dependent starch-binding outer membrane protein SusC